MKVQEAYKRFTLKVNKNDTNDGIGVLPSTFVLLFNSETPLWLNEEIKKNSDNSNLNWLEELLEVDTELQELGKNSDAYEFKLPENNFKYVSSFSLSSKGDCKNVKYFHYEKNALNKNTFLQDEFTGPQFDYEEGPVLLSKGKLKVFVRDFDLSTTYLTYYRKPVKIDMAGYMGFNGLSTNIDPDLSDENIESILNRMAIELKRNEKDTEGFQYAQNRKVTEP